VTTSVSPSNVTLATLAAGQNIQENVFQVLTKKI
jgi:hypothetical protein